MRLYKRCRNLPAGHCVTCSDAGCLSSIGTYLPGTVLQGCRLFKQCWSLPAGHCVAGVQTISAMSKPTCRALCCSGAGCLRSVGTYLPGTVLQGCRLYKTPISLDCDCFATARDRHREWVAKQSRNSRQ